MMGKKLHDFIPAITVTVNPIDTKVTFCLHRIGSCCECLVSVKSEKQNLRCLKNSEAFFAVIYIKFLAKAHQLVI